MKIISDWFLIVPASSKCFDPRETGHRAYVHLEAIVGMLAMGENVLRTIKIHEGEAIRDLSVR